MMVRNKRYIIGETAYNHEGNYEYLMKMIDLISSCGIDAVKFHLMFKPDSYFQKYHPLFKTMKKWLFNRKQWDKIIAYSSKKKLDIVALCDDVESMRYINGHKNKNLKFVEIHATGINDKFLLREAAKFKGTVVLGIGGSSIDEISYAIKELRSSCKNDILLIYGFQSYPTDYADINLLKMKKIKEIFSLPVGYADHTSFDDPNNEIISSMPAMMGFNVLEKHVALDEGVERLDYHAAVGREKLMKIIDLVDLAMKVCGSGELEMSKKEKEYGKTGPMKKAIVSKKKIRKGETITLDNLWFKRTKEDSVLRQMQIEDLIGLTAVKNISKDEMLDFSKVHRSLNKSDIESFVKVKAGK